MSSMIFGYENVRLCVYVLLFSLPNAGKRFPVLRHPHGGHICSQRGDSQPAASDVPGGGARQPSLHRRGKSHRLERHGGAEPGAIATTGSPGSQYVTKHQIKHTYGYN